MDGLFDMTTLNGWLSGVELWLRRDVLVAGNLVQLGAVLVALCAALWLRRPLGAGIARLRARLGFSGWVDQAMAEFEELAFPIAWLVLQWLLLVFASETRWGGHLIEIVLSLVAAWVAIGFASTLIRDRAAAHAVALLAWTVAALNIVGVLDEVIALLDAAAIEIGEFRLSVMVLLRALVLFAVLLWLALVISRAVERRLGGSAVLTPSVRVLLGQFTKIILVTLSVVIALVAVGIDLTAFAVFTGALGVGLGFGLQKLVANLFSGIMLLLDRSIKPGDVIAVGQTYGWVNFMGARYVSLVTRDGTEHLIPNETLITTQVENWSYSNDLLRLKIPICISYKSDVRKAMALVIEAAAETERVLDDPWPICLLKGFGDSSVDLEARLWINDPRNGVGNVKSAVLLRVWDKFHEHGIEIPFPQRDLHLRSPEVLAVRDSG